MALKTAEVFLDLEIHIFVVFQVLFMYMGYGSCYMGYKNRIR